MSELILFIVVAALAGLVIGLFSGFLAADRRNRRRIDAVGDEVVRLRALAEGRLTEEAPDLPKLLNEFHAAVEKTYRAADALEAQSELIREKTAKAREVKASVREIVSLLEEMGADMPYVPAAKAQALSSSLDRTEKAPPRLR